MHVFDLIDKGRMRCSAAWLYVAFTYWHFAHTHTHTPRLTATCPGLPVWAGTRKVKPIWILLKQEIVTGSGISWAICKSALCSRQITMPTPHHSVFFTGWMPFLPPNQQCQSTDILQFVIMCFGYVQTCKPVNSYTQIQIVFGRKHDNFFFTFFDIGSIVLVLSTFTSLMLLPIVPVSYYNHTTPI